MDQPPRWPPNGGFAPNDGDRSLDGEVRRREFVRYLAFMGGMAALDPERLAATLRGLVHVDRTLVDQLHWWTRELAAQWDEVPPSVLRTSVGAHLTAILELLAGPLPPNLRRDLLAVGAHTANLAGLVARMIGDDDESRVRLTLAGQLAASAEDAGVHALSLVWISDTVSAVQRGLAPDAEQRHALGFLERAEDLAAPSTPSALRAHIALRLAEEHAAAGDGAEARCYLDRADSAITVGLGDPDLYGLGWPTDSLHRAFRGNVELLAGDARAAVAVLADALDRTGDDATSNRAALLTDMAAGRARLCDLDEAVNLLGSAWAIAERSGLEDRRQRILGVRHRDLDQWSGELAVRQLDERIAG